MRSPSLNHAYKLIWSQVSNAWIAVSEIAKSKGKSKSQKIAAKVLALVTSALFATATWAGPEGGVVTGGMGSISQDGAVTTINQASQTLNLNWNTFNVASHETVNFVQPSATALAVNQILDTNGSRIMGNINANGQVWLINPNGIYFGAGAQVNVGSLLASTLNPLSQGGDANQVFGNGGTGSIINQGNINATHGYVAFVGNTVSNAGNITANGGTVAFGAGSQVSLKFADNQLLGLTVDQSTLNNLAENKGLIQANGGAVLLSAGARDSLLASVVNNEGVIEAKTVEHKAGKIILMGGMAAGTTKVKGTLDASAQTGNGGFIETSAGNVDLSQPYKVTTKAHNTDGGSGKTGTWLIDPNDYTIAASGGNTTGAQLGTDLASNNITISTATQGTAGGNGDIFVRDNVTWSSGNTLTLNAERNIKVLATIDASQGSGGKVALNYGQGAVAANNTATYDFGLTGTGFTGKINLKAGQNFSTQLGSNGTPINYTVITSLGAQGSTTGTDLQGINGNLLGNYVLGTNIDASSTIGWNNGAGFKQFGNVNSTFRGKFDGLGHTITGLNINRVSDYNVGLFGYLGGINSSVGNVSMVGGSVRGDQNVGFLVGYNEGVISNIHATGGSVHGNGYLGGLVGYNSLGRISNAYISAGMSVGDYRSWVGGLVAYSRGGSISNAYATGAITGGEGGAQIGGLVGQSFRSSITNAYATVAITFGTDGNYIGGLIGYDERSTISNVYVTGAVTVGGNSYGVGGLVGYSSDSNVTNSFWDTQTTGQSISAAGTGKTTAEMKNFNTFKNAGWDIVGNGGVYPTLNFSGTGSTWTIQSLVTSVNYTLNALTGTYTYQGSAYNIASLWSASSIFGNDYSSWVAGTDYTFSQGGSTVTGFTNAGSYSNITVNVLKSGFVAASSGNTAGNFTITPKVLDLSGSRVYDGTTNIGSGVLTITSGLVGSETLVLSGSGTVNSKNASTTPQTLATANYSLANGNNGGFASNYTLVGGNKAVTITKKDLTVTAGQVTKTYDGTTSATGTGTVGNLATNDSVNSTGSQAFTDKNFGIGNKTVRASGVTIKDNTNADMTGNYNITYTDNTTSTINKKDLTVTAGQVTKTYDGTTTATGTGTLGTLATNDSVNSTGSQAFTDKNFGIGNKTVRASGVTIKDNTNADMTGNYNITYTDNTTSTINKADAMVVVTGYNTTYNGQNHTATFTLAGVNGETGAAVGTVDVSGTTHKNANTYNDSWTFTGSQNYKDIASTPVTNVIAKANLTYVATPTTASQGQTPTLTGLVNGFVGGEGLGDLIGTLSWTTNANLSIPGFYAITGTGLSSQNYIFAQAAGNATALTVLAATPTTTSTPPTQSQLVSNIISNIQQPVQNPVNNPNSTPPSQLQVVTVNNNQVNPAAGGNTPANGDVPVSNQSGTSLTPTQNTSTLTIIDGGVNVGSALSNNQDD